MRVRTPGPSWSGEAARAARVVASQPRDALERRLDRFLERRDERPSYQVSEDFERLVHGLIGADWPCEEHSGFEEVWSAALDDLDSRGLQVGRGTFGSWDDGDSRLAQVAWCVTRHLRPERIVETGVARGLLTRVVLEAVERNDRGRLWSIDLPPLLAQDLGEETAAAVPQDRRERWTLLRGTSRRLLPRLLADLGQIDLFIHDSSHTTRNVRFELERAWRALSPGGLALIDDVEKNAATAHFLTAHPRTPAVISKSRDGKALVGCLVKSSADPFRREDAGGRTPIPAQIKI
jgi:hypothetical protein